MTTTNKTSRAPTGSGARPMVREHLRNYRPSDTHAFNDRMKELQARGQVVYNLAFGQSPFPVPACAVEALRDHAAEAAYLPVQGTSELREAICKFHADYDGLTLDPGLVITGPGSKELMLILFTVFDGDVYLPAPSWTTYLPQLHLAGKTPVLVHTSLEQEWRVTPEAITQALQGQDLTKNKLLILCNPDNPTGTAYDEQHMQDLCEVLREHNFIVASDEIYARLHFTGQHTSILKYYPERSILSSGFSKCLSAGGWRLGYSVFPAALSDLLSAVTSAASQSYSTAPAPVQRAVTQVLQNNREELDSYLRHCTRILHAVGTFSCNELQKVGVRCSAPRGGYYMLPSFEHLRGKMEALGIHQGQEFFKRVFSDTSVGMMTPEAFLLPPDQLSTRLSFVNFDGGEALRASQEVGLEQPLPGDFLQKHCRGMFASITNLCDWVRKQLDSENAAEDSKNAAGEA